MRRTPVGLDIPLTVVSAREPDNTFWITLAATMLPGEDVLEWLVRPPKLAALPEAHRSDVRDTCLATAECVRRTANGLMTVGREPAAALAQASQVLPHPVAPVISRFCACLSQSPPASAATRERSNERLARQLMSSTQAPLTLSLAALLGVFGEFAEARIYFSRGLGIAEGLTSRSPTNPIWLHDVAMFLGNSALARHKSGDLAGAEAEYETQVELLRKLRADAPREQEVRVGLDNGREKS